MASKTYDGNFKAYLLAVAPADWDAQDEGNRELTSSELTAGTRLLRLISDGGVSYTPSSNTASQALIDRGKVPHNIGTREYTGGQIIHERHFPTSEDDMWDLYEYGDKRWLVVAPDGEPSAGDVLHVFEVEVGEVEIFQPGRDTIQNFQVALAIQDWDMKVTFAEGTG